jgi:hypothetical protein
MHAYGKSGEVLRRNTVNNNLTNELTSWSKTAKKYEQQGQPLAANIFVGQALHNITNNNNNNKPDTSSHHGHKAKSTEVIRRPLKVTMRVYPESDNPAVLFGRRKKKKKKKTDSDSGGVVDGVVDGGVDGGVVDGDGGQQQQQREKGSGAGVTAKNDTQSDNPAESDKKKTKKKKKGGFCNIL